MVEINKSLDGTLEKAISASAQLKKMPGLLQDFMLLGDFNIGKAKQVKASGLHIDNTKKTYKTDDPNIQNLAAQLAGLDKSQQNAVFKMSDLSDAAQNATRSILEQTAAQKSLSGSLVESALKANGFSDVQAKEVIQNAQLVDSAGNYLVVSKDIAQQNLETALSQDNVSAALQATNQTETQLAATITSTVLGQQVQTATTWAQKFALDALTITLSLAKQAAISFGIGLITWAASKAVEYLMNLKTRSEELVETMNDSHDAAEQATKDVEEIQSKIDELNKSLKDADVDKIEDIVDPAERERLQAINDMLQAQLELKKQLEKDANDKANKDTSAVVNDKTEKSIYDFEEKHDWTGDYTTGKDITKTESLQEYTTALEDTTQKRRDLQVELDQIEASSGKDSKEYANKKKELDALNETFKSQKTKVEELSTAVSEQMGNYKTDTDSFAQYKDEYVAGTNAMTAATKALANAQGDTTVDTTNLDIFSEKVRQIKNDMDNGDSQQSDWKMFNGLGAFSGMTGESIINIDKDTTNQTDAEKAALEKLHQVADDNKISFENLIGVFEAFGIIQTSNASSADSYAEQLEKTMGVIDDIQSAYKTCSSAIEEYNKYGYMSVDSLQSLLQMDDEYLNTLELVNGKLQVNQSAYADLLATQYAQAQMEAISQAISELNAIAKGDAAEKAETFTEATEDEKNKLEALAPALKNATIGTGELAGALAAARSAENGDNTEEIEAKISSVMNALNTRLSLISTNMQNAMNGASGLKNQLNGFSASANKSSGAAQTFLDAWSTLTSAMKEFNEQNYLSMQTVQDLTGLEDKYTSLLKKNDVTGKLEIQTSKFQDLMEAELKEAKIKGDNATASQYNKILEWTDRNIQKQTMSYWDLVAAIEGYSAALEEAKGITDTFKDAWDNGKTVKEKTEKSRTGALDYEGTEAQSSALQDLLKYSEYDPELIGKAFNKETGKIDLSGDMLKNAVVKSLKDQATAARTEGGAAAEAIAQSYEKSAENIENDVISVQDYFDGLGSTIDEVNTKIEDIQSAFTDLDDVVNEYNAYGGLSVDAMQKLLTMQPEYLACLEMNGDQLVFNRDKMVELLIAQLEVKKQELASKKETEDQAQIIQQMIDMLKKDGVNAIAGMTYEADKLQTIFSNIKDLFSSLLDLVNSANDKKSNDLKIQGDAWMDVIDKRIDALNEQNDAQERAIELQKAEDALAKAQANKTTRVYGENGYEWEADASAVRDAQSDLSSKRREYKKQEEIDRLNKLKDKVQEATNLIGTSWDDYQKKLKYTSQFEAMTFAEMEGHYDGFMASVVSNMKAVQRATNVSNVITKLETLIDTLTKLGDVLGNLNGSTQSGGITGL
jgi:archaellum component FlaC